MRALLFKQRAGEQEGEIATFLGTNSLNLPAPCCSHSGGKKCQFIGFNDIQSRVEREGGGGGGARARASLVLIMGVGAAEVGSVRLTATPFGLPRTPRCACEHLVWVRPLKSCPPTFCLFWTYFLSFLSLSSVESLASALPNIRFSLSICSAFTSATCVCVCVCVCV